MTCQTELDLYPLIFFFFIRFPFPIIGDLICNFGGGKRSAWLDLKRKEKVNFFCYFVRVKYEKFFYILAGKLNP